MMGDGVNLTRWARQSCAAILALIGAATLPAAAQPAFPYDQEMLLEAKPLPGSRRVPILEVRADGKATLDMWCHSAAVDVAVTGSEIKFTFTSANPQACTPERIELDQAMAKSFLEITGWKLENDVVVLTGAPTAFRFRISTH